MPSVNFREYFKEKNPSIGDNFHGWAIGSETHEHSLLRFMDTMADYIDEKVASLKEMQSDKFIELCSVGIRVNIIATIKDATTYEIDGEVHPHCDLELVGGGRISVKMSKDDVMKKLKEI